MEKYSSWQKIALGCFLLMALLIGCSKREIKNIDSKGKNIICFGDSITWGYGAEPGEDYPKALGELLGQPVANAGVDSDTTILGLKRFQTDVLENDPLLVIIEMCGNDFLKKVPIETTMKNVAEMVDLAQNQGAMVAIVDVSAGMFLREYRVRFARLAQEKNAIFIPEILRGIITSPAMKSDFIHPNAAGYKIIAGKIYRAIIPYLKKNSFLRVVVLKGS